MRNSAVLFVSLLFGVVPARGQLLSERSFSLPAEPTATGGRPLSNSITDIVVRGETVWLGTGKGLSRSTDRGSSWSNFFRLPDFGEEDISALTVHGSDVWVATAHSVTRDDQRLPEGSGIRYSSDGGTTWKVFPQPRDTTNVDTLFYNSKSFIRALGITTSINNITYDIAATDSAIWIASFAGMVRKSTDKGRTWNRVIIPPDNLDRISPDDSLVFDLSPSGGALGLQNNLNHRAFSVFAENDAVVWIGTAGGINRTTDGGKSWVKFSHQNQTSPISGNFVVALRGQEFRGKRILWAATVNAVDATEKRGVSFSDDGGGTWRTGLTGEFCHNIGFKDSLVYAVTDNGIFRSSDFGTTWSQSGAIYDKTSRQRVVSPKFYSVESQGDFVWLGGNDGLVNTIDNAISQFGAQWTILRAFQPVNDKRETYAYPNPFSPDDEAVRLHYSTDSRDALVTVRIFDFGMNLVRTVIQHAFRGGLVEHDEIWDGKDGTGRQVANGTYFYQVTINDDSPMWGKILVIQ